MHADKVTKNMPNGSENHSKNDVQIDLIKKSKHARNYLIYNRKHGSGHLVINKMSIKILYKIDAWKRHAKSKEIIPNGSQIRCQNPCKNTSEEQ